MIFPTIFLNIGLKWTASQGPVSRDVLIMNLQMGKIKKGGNCGRVTTQVQRTNLQCVQILKDFIIKVTWLLVKSNMKFYLEFRTLEFRTSERSLNTDVTWPRNFKFKLYISRLWWAVVNALTFGIHKVFVSSSVAKSDCFSWRMTRFQEVG
jgi:hypothetical protein